MTQDFKSYSDKINELDDLTNQIPDAADEHQGRLFNESLVRMMGLLEESVKIKERELEILKSGYGAHHKVMREKNEVIKQKTIKVKKIRVSTQKEIVDIEWKLHAMNIEPESAPAPL